MLNPSIIPKNRTMELTKLDDFKSKTAQKIVDEVLDDDYTFVEFFAKSYIDCIIIGKIDKGDELLEKALSAKMERLKNKINARINMLDR
jgi:hypothetical protein